MADISLLKRLALPDAFGQALLLLALIATLIPYAAGKDFGVVKVPDFGERLRRIFRSVGPVALLVAIGLHVPLFPASAPKPPQAGAALEHPLTDFALRTVQERENYLVRDGARLLTFNVTHIKDDSKILIAVLGEGASRRDVTVAEKSSVRVLLGGDEYVLEVLEIIKLKGADQARVSLRRAPSP